MSRNNDKTRRQKKHDHESGFFEDMSLPDPNNQRLRPKRKIKDSIDMELQSSSDSSPNSTRKQSKIDERDRKAYTMRNRKVATDTNTASTSRSTNTTTYDTTPRNNNQNFINNNRNNKRQNVETVNSIACGSGVRNLSDGVIEINDDDSDDDDDNDDVALADANSNQFNNDRRIDLRKSRYSYDDIRRREKHHSESNSASGSGSSDCLTEAITDRNTKSKKGRSDSMMNTGGYYQTKEDTTDSQQLAEDQALEEASRIRTNGKYFDIHFILYLHIWDGVGVDRNSENFYILFTCIVAKIFKFNFDEFQNHFAMIL